jgi:outer membrane protein OmpA-like peptidoglycan-associated protein
MMKFSLTLLMASVLCAQVRPVTAPDQPADSQPIFRITVVERTTNAVSYRHRSGWTKVDLRGTPLAPEATGHADVNSRPGYIEAKTEMHRLQPAARYGPEYLTYVLWAITPEGRAKNLGEVVLDDGGGSHLDVTTDLQAFALIVTAEPYFGVTQPSDVVVMENIIRDDTQGKVEQTNVKYDLLKRGSYTMHVGPGRFQPVVTTNKKIPLQLFEAQNSVEIARYAGADHYASDSLQKAEDLLRQAQDYQARNAGSKPVIMTSREVVQTAETARMLAIKRAEDERIAREKKDAADRQAAAEAQAATEREAAARAKAAEDAAATRAAQEKAAADTARAQAETAKSQAEAARLQAEAERVQAERAKNDALEQQRQADQARLAAQQAQQQTQLAQQQAQEADRLRQKAEQDQQQLRQQLLTQLNLILATRDTARGLIVNMSDVLFDFNKYTLRPGAREKLAKISGIVLAHPGLKMEVDGYTDSVGTDEYNLKLSQQRADAVRAYLIEQGINPDSVTSKGFGKANPVVSNDTAAGRQQNRRVEMVVSGDIIGTPITPAR